MDGSYSSSTEILTLDFEQPLVALWHEWEKSNESGRPAIQKRIRHETQRIFKSLSAWQRIQLCRHPQRPQSLDFIQALFPDFMELHGDRAFGDDRALIGGSATFEFKPGIRTPIFILAQFKGRTTAERQLTQFGMPKPEGYRKAIRIMRLAERMRTPLLMLIDTPGAYPGVDAESRGQATAIAESIECALSLNIPTAALVIGEGGSGGALAIGAASQVWMMEHSCYSVISPESCASILWNDASQASRAADLLKSSARNLMKARLIDGMIQEPLGGAHRNWVDTFDLVARFLKKNWSAEATRGAKRPSPKRSASSFSEIQEHRLNKFRELGNSTGLRSIHRSAGRDAGRRSHPS